MTKDNTSGFGKVNDCDGLDKYISGREYRHTEYCHYTRLCIIEEILQNKSFLMSCCKDFNDIIDGKQFDDSKLHYGLCFATGVNENLAMWYMYSGFDGKGGRLRFTKARVRQLVEKSVYELYKWEKVDGYYKLGEKVCDLIPGENFKLTFRDVVYYKQNRENNVYDLKYNNSHNWGFNGEEFEKYKDKNNGFCKGLIWYYEKETRLLAELTGNAETLIEHNSEYKIKVNMSDALHRSIKVDFAPEITPEAIDSELKDKESIRKHMFNTSNVNFSAYQGTIKMNSCNKGQKNNKEILLK